MRGEDLITDQREYNIPAVHICFQDCTRVVFRIAAFIILAAAQVRLGLLPSR